MPHPGLLHRFDTTATDVTIIYSPLKPSTGEICMEGLIMAATAMPGGHNYICLLMGVAGVFDE